MKAREAQLKNFFQNVEVATRGVQQTTTSARWGVSAMLQEWATGGRGQLLVRPATCEERLSKGKGKF